MKQNLNTPLKIKKKLLEYEYSIYILIIVLKYLLYIAKIHIILIKQTIFSKVKEKGD